jgi:hypothetical protein
MVRDPDQHLEMSTWMSLGTPYGISTGPSRCDPYYTLLAHGEMRYTILCMHELALDN